MLRLKEEWMVKQPLETLNYETAQWIGVAVRAEPSTVAEYLMRQASRPSEPSRAVHIPGNTLGTWFVGLANQLGTVSDYDGIAKGPLEAFADQVAVRCTEESKPSQRPAILKIIAPDQPVKAHKASEYGVVYGELIGRVLPSVCLRILQTWHRDGHFRLAEQAV